MRISDWSSDVCSSDLFVAKGEFVADAVAMLEDIQTSLHADAKERLHANIRRDVTDLAAHFGGDEKFVGWRSEERRVGKELSVRVDLGGRRIIKKKKKKKY